MLKKLLAILLMLATSLAMAAVDVNKATEAQLDGVKGIGPVTSKLIMSERKKGEFKNWEDFIARVKGIGEDRAAKLSAEGLTVNGSDFKKAAAAKKDDKKEAKADAKADKQDAKAAAAKTADDKKQAKAPADKPVAAAAKPAASAKK